MRNNLEMARGLNAASSRRKNKAGTLAQWITTGALAIVAFMMVLTIAQPLRAQVAGTGSIQGTIQDTSGAVVAGATVTATNNGTGLRSAAKTSAGGTYVLPDLPPGDYSVEVKAPTFSRYVEEHIHLNALAQMGVNAMLKAGSQTEQVTVTAGDQPELETENGQVTNTIPQETYEALPVAMNGGPKSPTSFLTLVPGVTGNGAGSSDGFGLNFNGGIGTSSQIYVNGLPLVSSELQGGWQNLSSINTEDIDSFQVITSGVPAYYDGQGIANLVYKSGTNKFHGTVFENLRNTAFDAAGYFNHKGAPVEHQNEYGIAAGGPIRRDRIFIFSSYDGYKITQGSSPVYVTLPTVAMTKGDFSAFPAIYDPSSTTIGPNGVPVRKQFPNNQVPINSKVAAVLQSALPAPQLSSLTNNYFNVYENGQKIWMFLAKVDAKISEKNRISGVFEKASTASLASGANLPAPYGSNRNSSNIEYMAQLNDTHLISPNLVNLFGAGFTMNSGINLNPTQGSGWAAKAGLQNLPTGAVSTEFPMVTFSGGTATPSAWDNGNPSFAEIPYSEVLQDNLQWSKGKHSITIGGQVIFQAEELNQPSFWSNNGLNFSNSETGQFVQTGTNAGSVDPSTGNPYASFLLGMVDNAGLAINSVAETGGRWRNYAVYAQDDWKITPKLTVNVGLRYIIPKPFVEVHDRAAWFDPTNPNPVADNAPGTVQFAGYGIDACNCHTNVKTHYLTFGPRLGFAYSLNSKTVIRSSFAITHFNGAALGGNGQQQGVGIQGFSNNPSFSSNTNGATPAFLLDSGIPAYVKPPFFNAGFATGYTSTPGATGDQGGYSYDRPDTAGRSPYTEGWALTIERELPSSFVVNLTYAGSSSHFAGLNGGVGKFSNQIAPGIFQTPGMGALLGQPATAQNIALAQAIIPGIALPFGNFSGSIGQMLRPFAQYDASGATWAANPDPWADFGTQNYNALQATVTHNMKNGLYLLASYAWSKEEDEGGDGIQFFGANARSAYDWKREKAIGFMDTPQSLSITELYKLPIGKGKLVNVQNPIANVIVGGWELAGIEQYSSGNPLGPVAGNCTANAYGGHRSIFGNGGNGCYDDYNPDFSGSVKLAKIGSGHPGPGGTSYFNVNAFDNPNTTAQLSPYSLGNTPRTLPFSSMRNEVNKNEDLSISKTFPIFERAKFQFKVDALNLFNRATFGGVNMNAQDPAGFGQATNQSNTPRQLQMEGYIRF